MVCSKEQLLNREIEHLRNIFHHTNGYPKAVIENVISKVKQNQSTPFVNITGSLRDDVSKSYLPTHPYEGKRGKKYFVTLPKKWARYFAINKKAALVYSSSKVGSNFNLKDITKKEHKHDLVFGFFYSFFDTTSLSKLCPPR